MTNKKLLNNLLNQVEHLSDDQLYAGLTVLAKDTIEYLESKQIKDDIEKPIREALSVDREYWEKYGSPLFEPLQSSKLPSGFAKASVAGCVDLIPLHDPSIIHEWTMGPGSELFQKFKKKFKEVICSDDGPYGQFENGLAGQADLPVTIASSILAAGISVATFWYPLAIYFGLLLARTGLKTYCEID